MAKIMLVEDDTNLREIYQARLSAEGYETVTAGDGEEALAMAVKEKPDLIIADVMMPKISGFDMLDILRSTPEVKDTKIIMMTALSQAEDRARAGKLGADRYLVKSQVTLEDVVKTAKEVLENKGESSSFVLPQNSKPAVPSSAAPATPPAAAPATPAPTSPTPAEPSSSPTSTPAPSQPVTPPTPVAPPSEPPASGKPSTPPTNPPSAAATATQSSTSISIDAAGNLSQGASAEQTSVDAQIKDFIKKTSEPAAKPATAFGTTEPVKPPVSIPPPAAPTPPVPEPPPVAPPSPPAPTPQVPPAPQAPAVAAPTAPDPTPPAPAPVASPLPKSEVPTHSTKVIQPLNDITKGPNLDVLLAKEGDLVDAVSAPSADTVVAPGGATTLASTEPMPGPAAADESNEVAPPPSTPHLPGHIITPQTSPVASDDTSTVDPNSVAL